MKEKIFVYMIACNCVILFQSFIFIDLYVVIYTDSCSVTIKAVRLINMKIQIRAVKKLYANSLRACQVLNMRALTKREEKREAIAVIFLISYFMDGNFPARVSAIKYRWSACSLYRIMNRDDDTSRIFICQEFSLSRILMVIICR